MFLTKFEPLPWQPTWEKLVDIFFLKLEPPASYNSMALSDLTISFVESFKIRSSDIHHENEMLDETRSKPIQHEKFVGWKIYSRSNFHPTRFFFIQHDFFFFCYFCFLLNRSILSSNVAFLWIVIIKTHTLRNTYWRHILPSYKSLSLV